MADDGILDSYERAGVHLPALRRAGVTGGGLPVWTLQPAREPFASWRRLRSLHDRTGLWPFLAGSRLVDRLWQDAATDHDPTAVERGLALDVGPSSPDERRGLRRPTPRRWHWPWMQRQQVGPSASRSFRSPHATR